MTLRMCGGQAIDILIVFFKHQKLDFDQDHEIWPSHSQRNLYLLIVAWWGGYSHETKRQRKRRTIFLQWAPHMCIRLLSVFAI